MGASTKRRMAGRKKPTEPRTTVWILGDQLRLDGSALAGMTPDTCTVLMIESIARTRELPFHKQKIAFVWAAMRHFARELRDVGYQVDYFEEQPNYRTAVREHLKRNAPDRIRIMETAELGRAERLGRIARTCGVDQVEITSNNSFLSDSEEFAHWAAGRNKLVLETFYRGMRKRTGLLMKEGEPTGGEWNLDHQNRKVPPADHIFPEPLTFTPDPVTRDVLEVVERAFPDNFGSLDTFALPVTRADAKRFARDFFERRLELFGPYQDAMVSGQYALYHSLLSPLINVGLLDPLELCKEAERRCYNGQARLSSVEGFIRQLIGWREFVYQVYRLEGRDYLGHNQLGADLPLPDFYWNGDTDMACIADAVGALQEHGANHHIQRLMITGNFALIAGITPSQVNRWYWATYVDAYEWVVSPNVIGMALFADGGRFASKPYAASANYINKMSDYCGGCAYSPKTADQANSCPFNSLYWDFYDRNRDRLGRNPRTSMILRGWLGRAEDKRASILARANELRRRLRAGERL